MLIFDILLNDLDSSDLYGIIRHRNLKLCSQCGRVTSWFDDFFKQYCCSIECQDQITYSYFKYTYGEKV